MTNGNGNLGPSGSLGGAPQSAREPGKDALWYVAGVLMRRRLFIIGTAAFVAVASVVITLLMPNVYEASVRVLAPERGSSGLLASALMKNLPGGALSLLGGPSADYSRYLTILSSRNLHEDVVDKFDLVNVYEVQDKKFPGLLARKRLNDNLTLEVDAEYEYLAVKVKDEDPERAAEIANYFVRRMNELNADLASGSAGKYRQFIEDRYAASISAMDSVMDAIQAFQQQYGLYDLPAQTQTFFEQVGGMRAAAIEAEIQYETLSAQLGPDNSQVQALRDAANVANRKYRNALEGQEAVMPVPREEMAGVMRQYLQLQRESIMQGRILEVVRPLLEQARLDEQQKVEAVQVVDPAVAPERKVEPRRSIIVIMATLSAFVLAMIFAVLYDFAQRRSPALLAHLREAEQEHPEKPLSKATA